MKKIEIFIKNNATACFSGQSHIFLNGVGIICQLQQKPF